MKALLSNDDGYLSPALLKLHRICQKYFKLIKVIAPNRNCSGISSALTLHHPIYTHKHNNGYISVKGNPTDCLHISLLGVFTNDFDIVISGINLGTNLEDDVLYSGTVVAAIKRRFLGYHFPLIAVSITSPNLQYYDCAENVLNKLIAKLKNHSLPNDIILNINIPDILLSELKRIKVTRLSYRNQSETVDKITNKYGQNDYFTGKLGEMADKSLGTNVQAIKENYASIPPIYTDLTEHNLLTDLST